MQNTHIKRNRPGSKYLNPVKDCDLVMKGGITSGVVYPPAILKLAEKYRFHCIGGTSAGAIAAAAAAAAELGRESCGFEKLEKVKETLEEEGAILELFQPTREARPVFLTFVKILKLLNPPKKGDANTTAKKRGFWFKLWKITLGLHTGILLYNPLFGFSGTALGVLLVYLWTLLLGGNLEGWRLVLLLVFGWLGFILGGIFNLARLLIWKIGTEEQYFGMCRGINEERKLSNSKPPLTEFLNSHLDDLAGLASTPLTTYSLNQADPLTFGHLARKGMGVEITFKLITTNLSHNQPYLLPFENLAFIFNEKEMNALFPGSVVNYMIRKSTELLEELKNGDGSTIILPEGYHFLPVGDSMPVIVATRMSLSFPLLLCAVPLYTISNAYYQQLLEQKAITVKATDLQKNWFSDGGITSNFPIHLFDAWLPDRPTFGINLTAAPGKPKNQLKFEQPLIPRSLERLCINAQYLNKSQLSSFIESDTNPNVFLPSAGSPLLPEFSHVSGFIGFFGAIMRTMQNYRDNRLARLPSYRERIVQVRLEEGEGGLNLAMSKDTIVKIGDKGAKAAEILLPPEEKSDINTKNFNFEEHRWVRFRVLMSELEKQLVTLKETYPDLGKYQEIRKNQLEASLKDQAFYCPENKEWWDETERRLALLLKTCDSWSQTVKCEPISEPDDLLNNGHFASGAPQPNLALKITPQG